MKSLFFLSVLLSTSTIFAQLNIDSFYVDKDAFLINQRIIVIDKTSSELVTLVKNWAGTNFANAKEVLVSETSDQLVYNYIMPYNIKTLGTTNSYNWYIRLVIQIKDGKIRVLQYDDGNAFWPGSVSGGVVTPSREARLYKFADYFKDGIAKKATSNGMVDVKKNCVDFMNSLETSLKTETIEKKQNDW
jgi:hypothetical protein